MLYTISRSLKSLLAFCIVVVLASCVSPMTPKPVPTTMSQTSPTRTSPTAEEQSLLSDPFAYCAVVGTIDTPDERYTGTNLPDSIIQDMVTQGIVSADMPLESQKHTVWRCMNNSVWVCNFGVNIPCQEKANTSQAKTSAMGDFCKTNPVTGRATVYFWSCKNGKPEVVNQITTVDPQGYLAVYWHELTSKQECKKQQIIPSSRLTPAPPDRLRCRYVAVFRNGSVKRVVVYYGSPAVKPFL
jgi:hypothetical protein